MDVWPLSSLQTTHRSLFCLILNHSHCYFVAIHVSFDAAFVSVSDVVHRMPTTLVASVRWPIRSTLEHPWQHHLRIDLVQHDDSLSDRSNSHAEIRHVRHCVLLVYWKQPTITTTIQMDKPCWSIDSSNQDQIAEMRQCLCIIRPQIVRLTKIHVQIRVKLISTTSQLHALHLIFADCRHTNHLADQQSSRHYTVQNTTCHHQEDPRWNTLIIEHMTLTVARHRLPVVKARSGYSQPSWK